MSVVYRIEQENETYPNQREAISRYQEGYEEKERSQERGDGKPEFRYDPWPGLDVTINSEAFQQFGSLKYCRQNGPVGNEVANPAKRKVLSDIYIMPVFKSQIHHLKEKPEGNRPGYHDQELPPSVDNEGIHLEAIDDPIYDDNIGPPGNGIKPACKGFRSPEHQPFGGDKYDGATKDLNACLGFPPGFCINHLLAGCSRELREGDHPDNITIRGRNINSGGKHAIVIRGSHSLW